MYNRNNHNYKSTYTNQVFYFFLLVPKISSIIIIFNKELMIIRNEKQNWQDTSTKVYLIATVKYMLPTTPDKKINFIQLQLSFSF